MPKRRRRLLLQLVQRRVGEESLNFWIHMRVRSKRCRHTAARMELVITLAYRRGMRSRTDSFREGQYKLLKCSLARNMTPIFGSYTVAT